MRFCFSIATCSAQSSGARHPTLTGPKSRSEDPRSGVIKRHAPRRPCRRRPIGQSTRPPSPSRTAVTRSDTRLQPTSWSRVQTSERSKNALAPRPPHHTGVHTRASGRAGRDATSTGGHRTGRGMTRARDLPGEADGSATDESAFGSGVPHPVRFWPCGGDLGSSRSPFNW